MITEEIEGPSSRRIAIPRGNRLAQLWREFHPEQAEVHRQLNLVEILAVHAHQGLRAVCIRFADQYPVPRIAVDEAAQLAHHLVAFGEIPGVLAKSDSIEFVV